MPVIRYKMQQEHSPGCFRWASHWRCAVALVEELEEMCTLLLMIINNANPGAFNNDVYSPDSGLSEGDVITGRAIKRAKRLLDRIN